MKNYIIKAIVIISIGCLSGLYAQNMRDLQVYDESAFSNEDWLIDNINFKADVWKSEDEKSIIMSNGIISRTLIITPNAATTSLKVISKQEEHIRAIKPEAVLSINGFTVNVGGLTGQPNLAFLYPDWLNDLKADPLSFKFTSFKTGTPEKRFDWKKVRQTAPNVSWPPQGVKLKMDYQMVKVLKCY